MTRDELRALDFLFDVLTWGALDVERALDWVIAADLYTDDLADFIIERVSDDGTFLQDADVPALALEFIAEEAGVEMPVYRNYAVSRYRVTPEEAGKILCAVPEDLRGGAWYWMTGFIGVDIGEEDEEA